jgi:cellulose biosynthesis protein BcsQ
MKTIAFFNHKGGVGKTTLVYHLAHMLPRLKYPTLAVDLDPQANLTSAFFDENDLEKIWDDKDATILASVDPILEGTGDIRDPATREIADALWLIPGNLGLSRFEDKLSASWPNGFIGDPSALRTTSAFHRIIRQGAAAVDAEVVLIDVGPNLGAINRAALLAADYLVIPLAADLFSLQGLRNLGPVVRKWSEDWEQVKKKASVNFDLPAGHMVPAGYVVLQHAVRLDRPVKAFGHWMERIPKAYQESVLGKKTPQLPTFSGDTLQDEHCLSMVRNFRSLMPMAQDARKPMFDLKSADGAIGGHAQLVQTCATDFRNLAEKIMKSCSES